jgi:hypothetical protein
MNPAAALLPRAQALHDLMKLLTKKAEELRRDLSIAISASGTRDNNIDCAATAFCFVPEWLRQVVETMECALINLDCADVLAQMPEADDVAVDVEIDRRAKARA